ncbi:NAD(P)H-dependent oxidoreductase [Vibrio tritonius]|uniref:NAD(P)H-dependent oxidoreductase n=1 Tax=Vibrio tritonius TaxID=1435069 RepID=UPI000837B5F0|nr:NAD(P)H-dependent oxidoreductase [Vibrio tritonius]
MKTLVIVSHPYFSQSTAIKSLQNAALSSENVTVRNLESLYGDDIGSIDVAAEQNACIGMDRIVFMFPIHWFNLTPMLKAYLNQVWTYGWAFGPEGKALVGKEMLVVTTAGATEHTYSPAGLVQSTMEEVLTPMKASALYVGMSYAKPLYFYEAMGATPETLANFKAHLAARLNE